MEEEYSSTSTLLIKEESTCSDYEIKLEIDIPDGSGLFEDPVSNDPFVNTQENVEPSPVDSQSSDNTCSQSNTIMRPVPKTYTNRKRNQPKKEINSQEVMDVVNKRIKTELDSIPGGSTEISTDFSRDVVPTEIKKEPDSLEEAVTFEEPDSLEEAVTFEEPDSLEEAVTFKEPDSLEVAVTFEEPDSLEEAVTFEEPDFLEKPNSSDKCESFGTRQDGRYMDCSDYTYVVNEEFLYCLECFCAFRGDCPRHGPLIVIPDTPILDKVADEYRAMKTAPLQITVAESKIANAGRGVFARELLLDRSQFGPYEGQCVPLNEATEYAWLIRRPAPPDDCIDATDTTSSNWMRFVNCARNETERNLFAFQYQGNIYYRTVRTVLPGEELLVWYGDDCAQKLGIDTAAMNPERFKSPLRIEDSSERADSPHLTLECCLDNVLTQSADKPFTCGVCHKGFLHKKSLEKHVLAHNEDKPFVCTDCNERFAQKHTLDLHKSTHTGEKPFVCSECNECFSERRCLILHLKIHRKEKPFVCPDCVKCFSRKNYLERHARMHSSQKPFVCSDCNEGFSRKDNLLVHQRTHTGEKPFVCPECNKGFSQRRHLNFHMAKHSGQKHLLCPECNEGFYRKTSLDSHLKIHTGEKPFVCCDCGERFARKDKMENHLRVHSREKPFVCPQCDNRFNQKANLAKHILTHTWKPFQCIQCKESFVSEEKLVSHVRVFHGINFYGTATVKSSKDNLLTHSEEKLETSTKECGLDNDRTHTEGNRIVCPQCNEEFSRKDALTIHMRLHSGERPFECTSCHKKFTQKGHLKRHALVHTGEKPFECLVCGKRFALKAQLKRHNHLVHKIHTEKIPFTSDHCKESLVTHSNAFVCQVCNEGFAGKKLLDEHVKVHSHRKQWNCSVCDKVFSDKWKLTMHLRTHTKERPFECPLCKLAFTQNGHLKRHLSIHRSNS